MERVAGRVILLWGWRRALLACLAGALLTLAQAPFDFPAVCFLSFPVLVWLIDGATADTGGGFVGRLRPAFMIGWWFGFGYFVAGLWWIGNALLVEAESFAWALPLAVIVLPAALAIFYGLATAFARLFWIGDLTRIAALALGFGLAEWLRAFLLTGFPWIAVGYAAMPVPMLMQSVSVVGLYGMNALATFVFAAPSLLALPRAGRARRAGIVLALVLACAHIGFGAGRLAFADRQPASGGTIAARVVQPSIEQSAKWDATERDRIFKTYMDLSALPPSDPARAPTLLVWPETSLPFLLTDRPDALAAFGELLGDGQTLMVGAVRVEAGSSPGAARYSNALVEIDDRGEIVDAADKVHLVPFGEYLPFEDILGSLGLKTIVDVPVSFSAATARRTLTVGSVRVLPLICYEAIFPAEIAHDALAADLMLNVTNDAWYGDTAGPYQHFRQAQIRAAEFGRPLLRSGNNGISAAVDAYGRVVDALALDTVGVMDVEIPLGKAAWQLPGDPNRRGLAVLAFCTVFVLVARARQWRRRN